MEESPPEDKEILAIIWAGGAPKETLNEEDFISAQYMVVVYNIKQQ